MGAGPPDAAGLLPEQGGCHVHRGEQDAAFEDELAGVGGGGETGQESLLAYPGSAESWRYPTVLQAPGQTPFAWLR